MRRRFVITRSGNTQSITLAYNFKNREKPNEKESSITVGSSDDFISTANECVW